MLSVICAKAVGTLPSRVDVVVVVVSRVEAQLRHQLRKFQMQAAKLGDRHLPRLEPCLLLVVHQVAHQQVLAQLFLLRKPGRIDRAQPLQKDAAMLQLGVVTGDRVVTQLVVVTLVAQGGGELRRILELLLPVVGEDVVQRLLALGGRGGR